MDVNEQRKKVSKIIYDVLTDKLCAREAILKYPKDIEDASLKAAYHALVHYEADEDLRRRDFLYKEEQNNFLEFMAQEFQEAKTLPLNIIKSYDKYYKDVNAPYSKTWKGLIKSLCKFLNV